MARIVFTDMSGQERSVPLGDDYPIVSIGRATDCTIRSNRKSVSRRHAEFRYANGQFEIVDLNSSNGTYLIINDERKPIVGREYLAHNDEVWCGDFILRFFEEESAHSEYDDPSTLNADRPQQSPAFGAPTNGYGAGQSAFGGPAEPPAFGGPPSPPPAFGGSPSQPPAFGSQPHQDPPPFGGAPAFGSGPAGGFDGGAHRFDDDIAGPATSGPNEDIERLRAEKESIAELAERQKRELDDMQRQLEAAEAELDRIRDERGDQTSRSTTPEEHARVQEELAAALSAVEKFRADVPRLESEVARLREDNRRLQEDLATNSSELERTGEFESELSRLREENRGLRDDIANMSGELERARSDADAARAQASSFAADDAELDRLEAEAAGHLRDIATLEAEVERVTGEMRRLQREAEEATKAEGAKNREETEALRREVERHKRLVEEFERRNRELQEEVDELAELNGTLNASLTAHEAKITEFGDEIETLAADLEAARNERDASVARVAELEAGESVEELKNEIEGLKRRLKMEKERAGEDDARISEEIERLNQQVEELVAENSDLRVALDEVSSGRGASSETLAELHDKVTALDRIVDAIARTNLDPLGTVDRVRLQAAIRDTDPRALLAELIAMTDQGS